VTARAKRSCGDRQAAEGVWRQQHGRRRLMTSLLRSGDTANLGRRHSRDLCRHFGGFEIRHQCAAVLLQRLTPCSASVAWSQRKSEQRGVAAAADCGGSCGLDPQRAEAGAGGVASCHRPDAARRPSSAASVRSFPAGAGEGTPVCGISMCADRRAAAPEEITDSPWR